MASPHPVARSRTYPVTLDDAFPVTLATPLPDLFNRRYGPIPPITAVDQEGPWATVGQKRTIHTADGGSVTEHLVTVDEPHAFTYELTDIRGPLRPLVARVDGAWTFEPVGTGCRITWSWTIHPQSGAGALVLPVFGRLWQGYARRALDHLEEILLAA
jgi:hypothetical protein